MSQPSAPSPRTRLVREADRAVYDRAAAYKILDEGFICHLGFVADGQPFVIPTSYGRVDDNLYIHGSAASRMLRRIDEGIAVCVTVTLLDGLVLALQPVAQPQNQDAPGKPRQHIPEKWSNH